jgi:hypothetical protein
MKNLNSTCCKCGAHLKYPVIISGKVYGSDCASKHLGINDIPKHFTGDYTAYKKQIKIDEEKRAKEYAEFIALKNTWYDKYVEQTKRMIVLMGKVWNGGIVRSFAEQAGIGCYDTDLSKDSFTWRYTRQEPRWIENLSPKQIALIEKIENQ